MLDLRWIRDNPDAFDAGRARRGLAPMAPQILELDRARRARQTALQEILARRNALSKEISLLLAKLKNIAPDGLSRRSTESKVLFFSMQSTGDEATNPVHEMQTKMAQNLELKQKAEALEAEDKEAGAEIEALLASLPNHLDADVPDGADADANQLVRQVGEPVAPGFPAKQHFELGEALGLMDFDAAARLSGARFTVLRGALARLERALGQFMLDIHTGEFGYTEISPPLLVKDEAAFGTGQLPKFGEDLFRTDTGLWLIPTAEVPLTNLAAGQIITEEALPHRYTALTACFRSEAGAAGRDTRGMLRQHQFYKVELVSITTPEQSAAEHERMTACAETILKRLGLAYRVMLLCAGDTGFGAAKTYDIEVWLPGQGAWREISSCSNCRDFQARRMGARCRPQGGKGTRFVHTLNGSGIAVGRALIAVLETCQQPDGSIIVPEALRPYMGGLERIAKG